MEPYMILPKLQKMYLQVIAYIDFIHFVIHVVMTRAIYAWDVLLYRSYILC